MLTGPLSHASVPGSPLSMSTAAGVPASMFVPHSFSATQSSIRSSTARLADFASRQEHSSHGAGSSGTSTAGRSASAGAAIADHTKQDVSPSSLTGPSALSMMLASQGVSPPRAKDILSPRKQAAASVAESLDEISPSTSVTPRASQFDLPGALGAMPTPKPSFYSESALDVSTPATEVSDGPTLPNLPRKESPAIQDSQMDERTPLLTVSAPAEDASVAPVAARKGDDAAEPATKKRRLLSSITRRLPRIRLRRPTGKEVFDNAVKAPVAALPAVVLGLLLNVLDGVSYDESLSASRFQPVVLRIMC
jgi:hypothetical protein